MFTTVLTLNDRAIEFGESGTSVEEKGVPLFFDRSESPISHDF